MKYVSFILALSALAGCAATSSSPVSAGRDTYVVTRVSGAFYTGREPLLTDAVTEASAKCDGQGKTVKILSTTENSGPYIFGNWPKATVIFSCT